MWIKKRHISILITFLMLSSCKKDEVTYQPDDGLVLDTALITFEAGYQSHTATALNFYVDMLTLNGLSSETDYSAHQFLDPYNDSDYDYDLSSVTELQAASELSYSTVLLINLNNVESYAQDRIGPVLRRFIEHSDSLPTREVALASFKVESNTPTVYYKENTTSIFDNSSTFNINTFYDITLAQNTTSATTSGLYLKSRLLEAMDTLISDPKAQGDLSITLLKSNDDFSFSNDADVTEIITKATSNNIRINILGYDNNEDVRRIAIETGGFITQHPFPYENTGNFETTDSPVETAIQNLDKLLRREVEVHRCNVIATPTGSQTFNTGDILSFQLNYDSVATTIRFAIP